MQKEVIGRGAEITNDVVLEPQKIGFIYRIRLTIQNLKKQFFGTVINQPYYVFFPITPVFSFTKMNGSQNAEAVACGDLNYDGIVDSQDYTIIIQALLFKFDEEE